MPFALLLLLDAKIRRFATLMLLLFSFAITFQLPLPPCRRCQLFSFTLPP